MNRTEIAAVLTYATCNRLLNQGVTFPQVSFGRTRIDLLNLSKFKAVKSDNGVIFECSIGGYEVKSCRQDFLSDGKWLRYLTCEVLDRFEFVCPEGVITSEDLEPATVLDRLSKGNRFGLQIMGFETDEMIAKVVRRVGLKTYSQEQIEKMKQDLAEVHYDWDDKKIIHPSWFPCPKVVKRTMNLKRHRPKLPENVRYWEVSKVDILRRILYRGGSEFAKRLREEAGGVYRKVQG